jgi:predicted RNA-binding protein
VTYIPPIALQLKTFTSVEEMNVHMNLQYMIIKSRLTKSFDLIFHLIKKYACKVAGVCWLKQEKIATLARVSAKTVERAMQFLKEHGVVKIYHTKRSNGLNGSCYYVLQPFKGELPMEEEIIVSVEEENVGAVEVVQNYETLNLKDDSRKDKLSLSSFKALESSFKKEEEINYNARVKELNNVTEETYGNFVTFLVNHQFSEKAAVEVTDRVLQTCAVNHPGEVLKAYAKAVQKLQKRLGYDQPIYSIMEYFYRLVVEELRPSYLPKKTRKTKPAPLFPTNELADLLSHSRNVLSGKVKRVDGSGASL